MARKVEVVPYNPDWPAQFEMEAERLATVLGDEMIAIHHIGSTSVPGLSAKPIIDIMIVVHDIEQVDDYNNRMIELGYEPRGEFGISGRRYFPKGGDNRTHHVHIFEQGHPDIERHLTFTAYMTAHPDEAQFYAHLKEDLARRFPHDVGGYVDGKDGFIKEMDKRAKAWKGHSGQ